MNSWKENFSKKGFAFQFVFFLLAILVVISFLPYFFNEVIEPRQGIKINDLFLNLFPAHDSSWIIFALIYISLAITLYGLHKKPEIVLLGLKCYLILTLARMVSMYVFTLEAPEGIIPLHDPLVDVIAYGGNVFNKDLFFSGHVATLTLFVLLEERPMLKKILMANTILVAGMILLQRVHYTLDVLVAPFITYLIFRLSKRIG